MKPAGIVVHPGAGRHDGTLANGLVARFPELAGLGESYRWGLVHRLDRDTSGLLDGGADAGSSPGAPGGAQGTAGREDLPRAGRREV